MPVRAPVSVCSSLRIAPIPAVLLALAVVGAGPSGASETKPPADNAPPERQAPATPDIVPATGPAALGDDTMRVVLVKGAPDCKTDCPEWISAEGGIFAPTLAEFRKVLGQLGDRKVPVFINSPGGDVNASLEIGRMLRQRHLTVSVTHTTFSGCMPGDQTCARSSAFTGYHGVAVSTGAQCASSCVMVLAGGEKRYVAKDAKVGVHQVSTLMVDNVSTYKFTKYDISDSIFGIERELVTERLIPRARQRIGNDAKVYREQLAPYFTEMGMPETLVTLMQTTDPARIHWMTTAELADTNLMTDAQPGESLVVPPAPAPAVAPTKPADAPKPTADAAKPGHVASLNIGPVALRRSE